MEISTKKSTADVLRILQENQRRRRRHGTNLRTSGQVWIFSGDREDHEKFLESLKKTSLNYHVLSKPLKTAFDLTGYFSKHDILVLNRVDESLDHTWFVRTLVVDLPARGDLIILTRYDEKALRERGFLKKSTRPYLTPVFYHDLKTKRTIMEKNNTNYEETNLVKGEEDMAIRRRLKFREFLEALDKRPLKRKSMVVPDMDPEDYENDISSVMNDPYYYGRYSDGYYDEDSDAQDEEDSFLNDDDDLENDPELESRSLRRRSPRYLEGIRRFKKYLKEREEEEEGDDEDWGDEEEAFDDDPLAVEDDEGLTGEEEDLVQNEEEGESADLIKDIPQIDDVGEALKDVANLLSGEEEPTAEEEAFLESRFIRFKKIKEGKGTEGADEVETAETEEGAVGIETDNFILALSILQGIASSDAPEAVEAISQIAPALSDAVSSALENLGGGENEKESAEDSETETESEEDKGEGENGEEKEEEGEDKSKSPKDKKEERLDFRALAKNLIRD